jgi:hypothetical protein
VHDGVPYADANFSITLVDPTWTINLRAGPVPDFLDTVRIDVSQVTWKATPDWNASLGKTVTVTPSPPTAAGSANLPRPTGAVKTVTVAISGKCTTSGGVVNGIVIPAQSFALGTDTKKVGFGGTDETIALPCFASLKGSSSRRRPRNASTAPLESGGDSSLEST